MCIVALAIKNQGPIVILMNRDEFVNRQANPLALWPDTKIVAGRDEPSQGTWLAVSQNKKFGILTNHRNFNDVTKYTKSRGEIIPNYLNSSLDPEQFIQELSQEDAAYRGFNIILGEGNNIFYYSKVTREIKKLEEGIFVLSNSQLDTPWPKVEKLRQLFSKIFFEEEKLSLDKSLKQNELIEKYFNIMQDTEIFADELLPSTGASLELERFLSSIFLKNPSYGTRSSSLIRISSQGEHFEFIERTFTKNDFFETKLQY